MSEETFGAHSEFHAQEVSMKRLSILVTIFLFMAGPEVALVGQIPKPLPSRILEKIPPQMRMHVPMYSADVAMMKAKLYDVDLQGKPVFQPDGITVPQKPKRLRDAPIADYTGPDGYALREDNPSIAVNPVNKKVMVTVSNAWNPGNNAYNYNPCMAYRSDNGGVTWSPGVATWPVLSSDDPWWLQSGNELCSEPVVAYSPDGKRVYIAYLNIASWYYEEHDNDIYCSYYWEASDIMVTYSDDNGLNWDRPGAEALKGGQTYVNQCYNYDTGQGWYDEYYGFDYDKPWLATSSFDSAQSNYVYLTATRFDNSYPGNIHIAFTRSCDKGMTFDPPKLLESGYDPNTKVLAVLQGSRPASGIGPGVVVAWYNSGNDGWLTGSFEMHTAYSPDNGATFKPVVVAVRDVYELSYWLGPNGSFHRWWTSMFPSISMDGRNKLHIAYTSSPTADWSSPEAGDIRYLSSSRAPYKNYTLPITVNRDGLLTAQGHPAIAVENQGTVHLIWEDHRMSPHLDNTLYETYWARKVPGAKSFSKEQSVSDTPSLSSWSSVGDYTGLTVSDTTVYAVWTDRRVDSTIADYNNDVYGSRVKQ
jgi:hypothetical protein